MWLLAFRQAAATLGAIAIAAALPACAKAPPGEDPKAGKTLTFSEEFDTLSLRKGDSGRWTPRYGYAGPDERGSRTLPNNGEQQIYVDPDFKGAGDKALGLDPFTVHNGVLTITARATPAWARKAVWNHPYVSGLLTTADSFQQTYGYFEIRARTPKGHGLWPAFWLLRADGQWPPEIDILEVLGHEPAKLYQTVHWLEDKAHKSRSFETTGTDTSAGWHTYGLDWTARRLSWYFDGRKVAEAPTPPGLSSPMYVLLNLAVGGNWPGKADPAALPAAYAIDYVRVYAEPSTSASAASASHTGAP